MWSKEIAERSTYGRERANAAIWYQGTLTDPNEELPFPLEQLEAENAWNDMWDAMTEEEQDAYMKAEFGTEQ